MVFFAIDDEPDSFVDVEFFYDNKNDDLSENPNVLIDFEVVYTRAPEIDSDGEEDSDYDNLETRTVNQTHSFERKILFESYLGLIEEIQDCEDKVCYILEYIEVPRYRDIVKKLTKAFYKLKNRPNVERMKIAIDVIVSRFPGEGEEVDVDVKLAVAPASDEAVEAHLKTVVVESDEGCCVICMDEIRVGSDVAVVRMPCLHVFHRNCGEEWLRNSGICPVCRSVFPS